MTRFPTLVYDMPLPPAIIFGSAPNPHRGWSYSRGSAGRMEKLCGRRLRWFNIYEAEPERWDPVEAKVRAANWCMAQRGRSVPLLLLGTKVCAAFGIERPEWLEWYARALWTPMIAFPHPSGLNRWWNDPANAEAARDLAHKVASGALPRRHSNIKEDE